MYRIPRSISVSAATVALALGSSAAVAAPNHHADSRAFTQGGGQQSLQERCLTSDAPRHGQTFFDLAGEPAVFPIARETVKNPNFRTAAWTATELQVTLMSIPVGGDVGLEIHPDTDQFFRVESGTGEFQVGDEQRLDYVKSVDDGDVMFVPQGNWHNVVNTGDEPLQLYVLYAPAHHPTCTIHPTQADDPHAGDPKPTPVIDAATAVEPFTGDPGAVPFVFDVEDATAANTAFRTAAWTGTDMQLTLMDIPVGGDVGVEMHADTDQFLRVESGKAKVYFGESADSLEFAHTAKAGDAILVPAGTWHNIVNDSPKEPLELYSIYGPVAHPQGTVDETQADALAREGHH